MTEPRICPECKRALGHRPRDCAGMVQRVFPTVGPIEGCECRCRGGDVELDASGFYWPHRHRQPYTPPTFVQYGSMLVESDEREVRWRAAVAELGRPAQRERPARKPPTPPPAPPPPPVVTVPTRREQLIAENLTEMRKRRR